MRDIYGRKESYEKELVKVEEAPITPKNKELIKKWNNERLARNLKHSTVYKRSAQLRKIAEILGKDFTDCTRDDILRMMSVINTQKLKVFAPSRLWD
ncbi:MAG: hypothetical protein MI867_00105, partial [Pseudomonadales bacterium]|nr:hypothetical protein [Pseudomonadales bacterium]